MTFPSTLACATCLADKDSIVGQAQGFAILVMLCMLAFVFTCAAAFVTTFVLRQKRYQLATANVSEPTA